jgi:uncharacterized membrane protein HdeD (DUF308 family)
MSSLADLPELIGFFSYSREDDADSHGSLSALRSRIQGELRGLLGRTAKTFRLWQDKEAIPSGTLWQSEIKNAVEQAVFFIPIITPTVIASPHCHFELNSFLTREADLGRDDLVFPILYIDVPALESSERRDRDAVLSLIARRQYVDWRELRYLDVNSTEVRRAVARFCADIRDALQRRYSSPEERKRQEEDTALARAETERRAKAAEAGRQREAAEVERRAEEEARQRAAETERRRSETEAEAAAKRRAEAESGTTVRPPDADRISAPVATGRHWHRLPLLIEGIILAILGLLAISTPQNSGFRIPFTIGTLVLVGGIIGLITTFRMRRAPGFDWSLVSAIVAIVAGILSVFSAGVYVATLAVILTLLFTVEGGAAIMSALDHRRERFGGWGWMLVSGLVDLVLAAISLSVLARLGGFAIQLAVCINMVVGGSARIAMALRARDVASQPAAPAASLHAYWALFLAEGIAVAIVGLLAILLPSNAGLPLTYTIGLLFLAAGVVGLIATLRMRRAAGFAWLLVPGILAIMAGILLITPYWGYGPVRPNSPLSLFFAAEGVAAIMFALDHKRERSGRWAWMLASGIVDLILAAVSLQLIPQLGSTGIQLVVCISMVVRGSAIVAMALRARRSDPLRVAPATH